MTPVLQDSPSTLPSTSTNIQTFPQASANPCVSSRPVITTNLNSRSGPFKSKYNRSCPQEKRQSVATADSGFYSGRNSPITPANEKETFHPRSLHEFKGMYRVPCRFLHEPQRVDKRFIPPTQDRYKDKPRCIFCHYTGIHNLAWSIRYQKLEVFLAELNLLGDDGQAAVYDVTAVDAAGNTALHYAAAGGAGLEPINALIRAGADPLRINTGGQVFLHCIRPHIRQFGSNSYDADLIQTFQADLINLLNVFKPKGAFLWPDNEGNTPLDSLFARMTDTDIKDRTFQ